MATLENVNYDGLHVERLLPGQVGKNNVLELHFDRYELKERLFNQQPTAVIKAGEVQLLYLSPLQ